MEYIGMIIGIIADSLVIAIGLNVVAMHLRKIKRNRKKLNKAYLVAAITRVSDNGVTKDGTTKKEAEEEVERLKEARTELDTLLLWFWPPYFANRTREICKFYKFGREHFCGLNALKGIK